MGEVDGERREESMDRWMDGKGGARDSLFDNRASVVGLLAASSIDLRGREGGRNWMGG